MKFYYITDETPWKKCLNKAIEKRSEWYNEYGYPYSIPKSRKFENNLEFEKKYAKLIIASKENRNDKYIVKLDLDKVYLVADKYFHIDIKRARIRTSYKGKILSLRKLIYPNEQGYIAFHNRDKFDYRSQNVYFTESNIHYIQN